MKYGIAVVVIIASAITGCASSVVTYDADNKIIGKCEAKKGFILGAGASCTGSANQEGKGK